MKIVVVGAGSIGTRHIKNLRDLKHDVYAVDKNKVSLDEVSSLVSGSYLSLREALKKKPESAFICTYSNAHIEVAMECARAGAHLFIEKPLSRSLMGVKELVGLIRRKKLISMVGCNMRFHPALAYIKDTLDNDPDFSRKLWANMEFGYYLPFAKPDYRSSYMANKKMGGGLIFDSIHELDYALWFMGEPKEVFCASGTLSKLKIDTQDQADMLIRFRSGALCSVHMDYLQQGYTRRCKIVCENGTILWDFPFQKIGRITVKSKSWSWKPVKTEILYNQMYKKELEYFLRCVRLRKETMNPVEKASRTLSLAVAAQRSSRSGRWEKP